jgi:hypothetical protein
VFAILESPNGNPWVDKPITIVTSPETGTELDVKRLLRDKTAILTMVNLNHEKQGSRINANVDFSEQLGTP